VVDDVGDVGIGDAGELPEQSITLQAGHRFARRV
jgi:hypothetical protein